MPLYSPEDADPAPPMTPLLLGPDETSSSSEGEEGGGSSDEEEGDAAPTSKHPQSQKQGQHAYLQGYVRHPVSLMKVPWPSGACRHGEKG